MSKTHSHTHNYIIHKDLGSVSAGRSPRRQMRRYLPCGERFVMSLATVANTKNEMLPQYL